MIIDKVLAVYNMSPLLLVVESDEGKLFELSLKDLKTAGHIFSDAAWKSLVEDYRPRPTETANHTPVWVAPFFGIEPRPQVEAVL
jgi:hypothetical protein